MALLTGWLKSNDILSGHTVGREIKLGSEALNTCGVSCVAVSEQMMLKRTDSRERCYK